MANILLDMKSITKQFPGVKALDNVNLQVQQGEIHALCGENGAGKSTLMKVLSGVYEYGSYEGEIHFQQELCMFKDVRQSEEKGIAIIHQELALIPELTISENIFLGHERGRFGMVDWDETTKLAENLLKRVNLSEPVQSKIKHIGVGKQQLVEIAKALAKNVKLLILDEPTASLNETDSQNLLNLLLELKQEGITSIIISHKLNEIKQIADKVTIIRDGQTIKTLDVKIEEVTEDRIIRGMVGRSLSNRFPDYEKKPGETILEVKNWNVYHPIQRDRQIIFDASFHVKKGEIIGIAGLMGAGRTELAMSMFGGAYGSKISGSLVLNGNETSFSSVSDAIKSGLAYATEDRKSYGLILMNDVKENISLASLNKLSRRKVIHEIEEVKVAEDFRKKMRIKTPTIQQETGNLSGGNQQKVVLSKWIFSNPDVLILDEPTRGIDVGAKYEIYTIIQELVEKGKGIIMISSELPELIGMCSRVYAMNKGRITGEVYGESLNQEDLMRLMTKEVAYEDISYNHSK
ncbi:multiple monosaccharide ABC transporter ATP-binding protein [Alkalicoccobacillus plakortidis]|uniref:Sugar ABC transporter ATP-binding protein n=1 Tax=Alkalicoccobacillus plakortidis TaxID=444060 RepID=A0ABT0XIS7_9BACI|nr:multiple monosaccharide ABC transporter ATP-binding protein [Alkalicoccobacillus plakortidis]MCM2675803.1 sugar ABC transporter ATP-binding protein [Alkalicoccobacillus plakortidis]